MAKFIFDQQINGLLTPYINAGDVALSVIVDPPADLPALRKIDCAVLDTTAMTITKHDEQGAPGKVIDISGASDELEQAVNDLKADVRSNTGEINVLIGVTAATDAAVAATDLVVAKDGKQIRKLRRHVDEIYPIVFDTEEVAANAKRMAESADVRSRENADTFDAYVEKNDKDVSTLQQNVYSQAHRLDLVENKSTKNKTLIDANRVLINEDLEPRLAATEGLAGENESSIIELQSDMQTAKPKAEAADKLSKTNAEGIETLSGAVDGLNSLIDDNATNIGKNKTAIESLESSAVKEGGNPVFESVTAESVKSGLIEVDIIESELALNVKVGGNTLIGVYADYVSLAGADFGTCKMRPVSERRYDDIATWGAVNEIIPTTLNHIQHGDDAVLNSLDMGHDSTPGFIKNLKDAELDGDAVNLGQLKQMLDSIFTSEIDLHDNNLQHVGNINGRNPRTTQINNVKRVRSDMGSALDSISFDAGQTQIHSNKARFMDGDGTDLMTVEKSAGVHVKIPIKLHKSVDIASNNLNNVKGIGGVSDRSLGINHIKKLRSRADGQDGESIEFLDNGIDFKSKNYHFKDDGDTDKFVIGESHTHFKGQDVQFHEKASFDKEVTFGTNSPVNINNALNMHGHSISNVRTADNDNKATNLGHIKQLIKEGAAEGSNDVLSVDDLDWSPVSQDFRGNTKKIIDAMPKSSIVIGRHDKTSSPSNAKYNIINKGSSGATSAEPQPMIFQISKDASGVATGFATASTGMSTVVRFLTGANFDWASMTAVNAFELPDDQHADSPEGHFYFTDQGIHVSEHDEESGNTVLKPLEGYNSPQLTQDVEQHSVDLATLKDEMNSGGKSTTEYFKNTNSAIYAWPSPDHTPIVDVYVLDTHSHLVDSYVTVADDQTHLYSGRYNAVGVISISGSVWSTGYAYHNAYKHQSEDFYLVFSMDKIKWVLIEADNPHTSVGQHAAIVEVELGGRSSLPQTYAGYTIETHFENLDSLHFTQADSSCIKVDATNKFINLDFGTAMVSGFIVIK